MRFGWWEPKRLWTLKQRGLDFREAERFFDGRPLLTAPSPRDGEERYLSVGMLDGRAVTVIWMDRDEERRIISMRRARDGEKRRYGELYGGGTS